VSAQSAPTDVETRWQELTSFDDAYTCYSAAVACWAAHECADWRALVDGGLTLTVFDACDGLFGFAHFPADRRAELGLTRECSEAPREAVEGVLAELERSGRTIIAGDGVRLPWHVAHARCSVPHWFVLSGTPDRLEAIDPFACRNQLGTQQAKRLPIAREELPSLLEGLPGKDPVYALRERLALGDDNPPPPGRYQWLVRAEVGDTHPPAGLEGPDALAELARHMRTHAQDVDAYRQADDLWSIARHRAFLSHHAALVAAHSGEERLAIWTREHAEPLAKRWAHMAPLLMQARLALGAGREASDSVSSTLEDLAGLERTAAQAFTRTGAAHPSQTINAGSILRPATNRQAQASGGSFLHG
jgi:hypothetical protein